MNTSELATKAAEAATRAARCADDAARAKTDSGRRWNANLAESYALDAKRLADAAAVQARRNARDW